MDGTDKRPVLYDPGKTEAKWQERWRREKVHEPDLDHPRRPFYNLMMFPYPSAEGLHVGNMYAFTGADIFGRMKRMQGYDVFEPIGLDGFGIHAENYALKIDAHPMDQAVLSEKRFYEQLASIGNGFAWDERLETYDPGYYRWTQWLFVQMFRHGFAYRKRQSVNWCPKDQTVLADEQVENGRCERCGTEVVKKDLEQWFFRITEYAERLLKNLDVLDWTEKVKIAQRNWIGKSEGAEISFPLNFRKNPADNDRRSPDGKRAALAVFTTRPDTLFGATYLVLSPEHLWVTLATDDGHDVLLNKEEVKAYAAAAKRKSDTERLTEGKEKTGVEIRGVKAINPATGGEIPIFVADYVLASYGTGAIMAVPAHDERDFEFAKKFGLPVKKVVAPPAGSAGSEEFWEGGGVLMDSGKFTGMDSEKAKWEIAKFAGGERKVQYRLRDWLISRQRYWGPPIPMIHCDACAAKGAGERPEMPGWYAVEEKDLPVKLPHIKNFRPAGTGVSPLAAEKSFYEVKCPSCGGSAKRETDVSDTFLDSAWYYLRYLDPEDTEGAFNAGRLAAWLPDEMRDGKAEVSRLYTGGAEHAVLHLLYVRFVAMALHDWGLIPFEEPFKKFRAHGLIIKDGAKMSKSKGNVINPDEYIKKFGADTLRMYLMFLAPFEQGGDFRDAGVLGVDRFLRRVWAYAEGIGTGGGGAKKSIMPLLHRTIRKVGGDIAALHYNTAVSALMVLLRGIEEEGATIAQFETFLKLLAPFAPHMTEEIWREVLNNEGSIHRSPWPEYDEELTKEDTITLVLQVNGKVKDTVEVEASIGEDAAKALALGNEKIKHILGGKQPAKVIYVEKKLVNIVA